MSALDELNLKRISSGSGTHTRTPRVLSIAGSDSGGGAGIQADLKAFARCGVHGMTAITAITVQNTVAVLDVHAVPARVIEAQVRAVVQDIGVDAVKVGMIGSAATARAVVRALAGLPRGTPIVIDPVMVAESGARLLEDDARHVLVESLLPLATVVTPNLLEARMLAGVEPGGRGEGEAGDRNSPFTGVPGRANPGPADLPPGGVRALARAIRALGPRVVVVTGGHGDTAADLYDDGTRVVELTGPWHPDGASHGSGCTHASVLAAELARGRDPLQAARRARELAAEAVGHGLRDVGAGAGPVDVLDLASRRAECASRPPPGLP